MKTINEFIESKLNYASAARDFKKELAETLEIDVDKIKQIKVIPLASDTRVKYVIEIHLTGSNRFKAENVSKVEGLSIITPNRLEIEVWELNL